MSTRDASAKSAGPKAPTAAQEHPNGTPSGPVDRGRYRRLPTGAHGLDPEEVSRDQRERLQTALIELIAERGYQAVRILDLDKLARVSRPTFYSLYADKEELFLAAYDGIAKRTASTIMTAYATQGSPGERLRRAMHAFAELAAAEPEAVSLMVLGAFGAGPGRSSAAIARSSARAEHPPADRPVDRRPASPASRRRGPDREGAILGGIREVTAARLRRGKASELPGLADELAAWAGLSLPAGLEHPSAALRASTPRTAGA